MPSNIVGLTGVGLLLVFMAIGMPVALAAALTGFLGLWYLAGSTPALSTLGSIPYANVAAYSFTVLPLFILMGSFASHAGLASQAFETGKRWVGHVPGGLAIATVIGQAFFGAACGSSAAAASVFARITIPEMEKLNYKPGFAAAVVAATGTFASMIPPSGIMIVYAIFAEVSMARMLIGGVFPGIMTAILYGAMLYLRVKRDPSLTGGVLPPTPWRERARVVPQIWGVVVIAAVVIGGLYSGVFTPTEAGGIAAAVTLLLLLIKRGINRWMGFRDALLETGRTNGMIFLIIIGFVIFTTFIGLSQVALSIGKWIAMLQVNPFITLAAIMVFLLILGMFLPMMGILLLSLPVVLPIVDNLGFDPIWFGVCVIKTLEIAQITPPVALNVYVVNALCPHIPLSEIFRGILPFVIVEFVALAFMIAFPQIILFLPNRM